MMLDLIITMFTKSFWRRVLPKNLKNLFVASLRHHWKLQTQVVSQHLVFSLFATTQVGTSLLMHSPINWTAVLLVNPYKSKQTMIYNSHDLWSPGVLKYHHLFSYLFIHTPTTDKEKKNVDVDALDDFIQNLLMCLLCTINLKPLGVSEQSVAFAAILLLGKMISCFVNCRDGDTCILMGNFRYPCFFFFFCWVKMNNC